MGLILRGALILLAATVPSWAYPSGAPAGTCLPLIPRHDTSPQSTPSPYRIEVNSRGSEVQIDLVGNEPFRGFLINARLASDPQRIVPGFFSPQVDPNAQTLDCLSEKDSGITHTSSNDKSAIRAVWTAPPGFDDRVIFMGAVVKSYDQFWSDMRSVEVQVRGTGAALVKAQIPERVYDNCGVTDGCFGLPLNCIATRRCELVLGYHEEPGYGYFFQMVTTAGTNKYVAAGISHDNLMGDDAVVECVDIGGNLEIRESWNVAQGHFNELIATSSVEKGAQSSDDGVQSCLWKRPYTTVVRGTTFDLRDKKYILLAMGNTSPNGKKRDHDQAAPSPSVVDFSALRVEGGDDSHIWVQTHGTLMTVAWLFTASLGMMIARHFKNVWEDKMPCGVKMWFAYHRLLMILTLLFSIVGVSIMFYRFGIFTPQAGLHPIIGLICVALGICQPIMSLFRCHPESKNRPLFNWAHWLVGYIAQIFGVVAISLAVDLSKAGLQGVSWFIYLIMAFVVFNVLCHIFIQIHVSSEDERVSTTPDIHLQAMGSIASQMAPAQMIETKNSPGSEFRHFMLRIYIVGLLFIVGAMVAVVWFTRTELI